jgi:hypothetical protein
MLMFWLVVLVVRRYEQKSSGHRSKRDLEMILYFTIEVFSSWRGTHDRST